MKAKHEFIPLLRDHYPPDVMKERSSRYYHKLDERRSVREFSDSLVPHEVIQDLLMAASTAPSGAHKQPWTFCAVSNPDIKRKIREAAEKEEYDNYHGRMSDEWLKDLQVFDTDWHKPFLEIAPWLIVVFKRSYELDENGASKNNYYVNESVGIATGMLLTAIHHAGLVALTHTPSPMNFLVSVLDRPKNERPFLLIPVGYPADNCVVPDIKRKTADEVIQWYK
jgi:iodotyrosine deiodinase